MAKTLRAFFKSEDDVQSVEAELHRLHANNVIVDEMPDDGGDFPTAVIPLITSTTSSTSVTANNNIAGMFWAGEDEEDTTSFSHVLEFNITEEDYQEALRIIANNGGHVEKQQK